MKPGYEPIPDTVRRLREEAGTGSGEIAWMTETANEIMTLRYLLAMARGITYGDDGELQCGAKQPFIDYARDPATVLEAKIGARGIDDLMAWIKANPEEAAKIGYRLPECNAGSKENG